MFSTDVVSVKETGTGALEAVLDVGRYNGRPVINVLVSADGAATFTVAVSNDCTTWYTRDTITLSSAGSAVKTYTDNACKYIKVFTVSATTNVIEICGTR